MNKRRFLLLCSPLLLMSQSSVIGQGLKGAPEPVTRGSAPLIQGKTDDERWVTFLAVQKRLIGMSYEEVTKTLGPGFSDKRKSNIQYELTETKTPSAPAELASIDIFIKLDHNKVDSYTVKAVHWSK